MLPRRPKYVASGREDDMEALMEVACRGGVILLEGATGVGKTSLALECAHRLPRALWYSAWPHSSVPQMLAQFHHPTREQLAAYLEEERLCLFLDHTEVLEGVEDWLAWASHHLRRAGCVALCDRRLSLPDSARVPRRQLEGSPRCQQLPTECRIMSLRPRGLPRVVLGSPGWLTDLEARFLTRNHGDWVGLHPSLIVPGEPQEHSEAVALLAGQTVSPLWIEELFFHLWAADQSQQALNHWQTHHLALLQAGQFEAVQQICQQILDHQPRLALAHYALGEARAGMGKLDLARADYTNAYRWGDEQMKLRSLAGRAHLLIDLGHLQEAEQDADQALTLARQLGGRQPGQVKALNGKSRVCNLRGQAVAAEQWAQQALELSQSQQDSKGEAYSYFILAQALAEQQRWQDSLQNCLSALQLARQQQETRLTFLARYWAGAALLQLGRLEWAEEWLREAWSESLGFADLKMQALGELMRAQSLLALERHEEARYHLSEAEKWVRRSGYPVLAIRGLLLKEALEQDPEWGRRAQSLADSVGLTPTAGAGREVWTQGSCRPLPEETVAQLRDQRNCYDLFVDLELGQVFERQRGPVPLLGKKIPTALLLTLMRQPGQCHSSESLYAAAWGHEFERETSAAQVRKNISALRNLIEPERKQPRYLKVRDHAYGVTGGYYFCESASYCVIHPEALGIP